MIAHWKDLSEDYNIFHKISRCNFATATYPQKHRLGPQNGSRSSGPEKLLKIVNYQNCQKHVLGQLEKVGGHRYPPGSLIQQNVVSQLEVLEIEIEMKLESSLVGDSGGMAQYQTWFDSFIIQLEELTK
jgi:hypothetical protein